MCLSILKILLLNSLLFLSQKATSSEAYEVTPLGGARLKDIEISIQEHALSCEAAALSAALKYFKIRISESDILKEMRFDLIKHVGSIWGDPDLAFVGNINGTQGEDGYGIHATGLQNLASKWLITSARKYENLKSITTQINQGKPVLAWISYESDGNIIYWQTRFGKKIKALDNEHVVLIYGYEGSLDFPVMFYVMDPARGLVIINSVEFQNRWEMLERTMLIFKN
jgi:uncharacterized protein YvpB